MASKLRKGDMVEVICGKDKGDRGKILEIYPAKQRVLVEGLNMVQKHVKAGGQQEAGIVEKEAPLHISNVMLVDPDSNKKVRVGFVIDEDGTKSRVSKATGNKLD
ncbi:MAG: 50S ribosomal protein L24 [Acidobacteria bacterium]|nr:MAG: 50S ribosomal protein L24 [Acidobacteriota bacterium]